MIDLEFFWLTDLLSSLFGILTAYTSWYEVITKLYIASGRDPIEIEYEVSTIGAGFWG